MSFETFVAKRFLKIRHQRKLVPLITILAVVGVAVGVMVLTVVIAVMTGFQNELKKRILGIEAPIMVMKYGEWIADFPPLLTKIDRVHGVTSSAPYVYAQGMLRSPTEFSAVVLKGIDPERSQIQVGMKGDRKLDRLLAGPGSDKAEDPIVIGTVLADKLKVKPGDSVLMMVVSTAQNNSRLLPGMHRLKIAGLFETGMHQYDGAMGFMNIHDLQQIMDVQGVASGIEVRVANVDHVESITRELVAAIGSQYWAAQWKQMHRNLFSMLSMQKMMMYVILTLIILVAAFNIASALVMMVREKVKEIAILKVMGASNRSIQTIFLSKGMVIGLTGVAIGAIGGMALCGVLSRYPFIDLPGDVYFLTTLPVSITLRDMALIILGTLGICGLASFYPARRAAKIKPVDGVRYS